MKLMVRGILWFGLYLFLVLLPLITAVLSNPDRGQGPVLREIAVGLGQSMCDGLPQSIRQRVELSFAQVRQRPRVNGCQRDLGLVQRVSCPPQAVRDGQS